MSAPLGNDKLQAFITNSYSFIDLVLCYPHSDINQFLSTFGGGLLNVPPSEKQYEIFPFMAMSYRCCVILHSSRLKENKNELQLT